MNIGTYLFFLAKINIFWKNFFNLQSFIPQSSPLWTQWIKKTKKLKIVGNGMIHREMQKKIFAPQNVPLQKILRKIFKLHFLFWIWHQKQLIKYFKMLRDRTTSIWIYARILCSNDIEKVTKMSFYMMRKNSRKIS